MSKSKKIKELEIKVEALSIISEIMLELIDKILREQEVKDNIDSGKWYKDTP